jgi:hypothetical protein
MKAQSISLLKHCTLFACMLLLTTGFVMNAHAAGKRPGNAHINASIPDQWKSNIIKEVNGDVTIFSLVNGDAVPVYLFSVTEIAEQEWVKVKTQLPDVKLIERKNGNIYFSDKNQKTKVKGPCSELYQQIYPYIDQMISSVQID